MPDRIANKIILVEDVEQQNLLYRYLERCGHNVRDCRFERPARRAGGSGEKFVRDQYPQEVKACRSSLGRRASALLVVMIDADTETTERRASQLSATLETAGMDARGNSEPIVVLVPKRHVETWIRALLGNTVDEQQSYKNPQPTRDEVKEAAETLYGWTRPNANARPAFPLSLTGSRPEWRKIP